MKNGTHYGKKVKAAYAKFRGCAGDGPLPGPVSPIEQLIVAVLSQESTVAKARKALAQINSGLVDYNELRVSTPAEIANAVGRQVPRVVERAKSLIRVLNAVYQNEYAVSLDGLAGKGVREVKAYLDQLDGATPYVVASVMLWSLNGHAIPINDTALAFLKRHDLVDADAQCAEVQSFLERHISAADAKSFCLDLEAYIASKPPEPTDVAEKQSKRPATGKKSATKPKKSANPSATKSKPADTAAKTSTKSSRQKKKAATQ
jgi:endonuclease III